MPLAQTRRDRKETRARHSVHAVNMKHTLKFVFIDATRCCFVNLQNGRINTRCAMPVLSTYKMAACAHAGSRI